jgi:hypothetical protein
MASLLALDARGAIVPCGNCSTKNRLAFERLGEALSSAGTASNPSSRPRNRSRCSAADFDRLVTKSSLPLVVDTGRRGAGRAGWSRQSWKVAARQAARWS